MSTSSDHSKLAEYETFMENVEEKKSPQIFTELFELFQYEDGHLEWKEVSRWIKYEEDVLEEGNRWSKPHVPTPKLSGWMTLRQHLRNGVIMVDVEAKDLAQLCSAAATKLLDAGKIKKDQVSRVKELWMKKHRHQFEGPRKVDGNLGKVIKDLIVQKLESKSDNLKVPTETGTGSGSRRGSFLGSRADTPNTERKSYRDKDGEGKVNLYLQKKIAEDAEAAVILEGAVDFIDEPVSVFIRLDKPVNLQDVPEVDIGTKYLYFLLLPMKDGQSLGDYHMGDAGKSLATAITDQDFANALYRAETSQMIMDALDAYTNGLKILPADYNTEAHMIEPPSSAGVTKALEEMEDVDEDRRMREASGLVRSGKIFGGLINDIKRKKPFYLKDFWNGLHPQCISSFLFLYFACLAPIVAFGGLLGKATENRIATIESLVSGLISSVLFGLFAGQPMVILGSTGPVYMFEKILYQICQDNDWDYLSLRLWIGIWVGAILIVMVALDASSLVCYITRFTEELFAILISFIFIFNAMKNIYYIGTDNAFEPVGTDLTCTCNAPANGSDAVVEWANLTYKECVKYGGEAIGENCGYTPNIFLMSLLLGLGTFVICMALKEFRNTGYLPGKIRSFLSDFAVIIAIITMSLVRFFSGVETPSLDVPDSFKPTWEGRSWLVTHALMFPDHLMANPWWVDVFLAPVMAILATILIFMDQQITAVIVNRKENKLTNGCGYHLDLLVLSMIIIICSVFGLPWFVAATVLSINHTQSLRKESQSSAPGEKPRFLGIREQRVTAVLIGVFIGLSTLITPVLGFIPMPVLFGVFLFMGVSSLRGLQFFDRILLVFIPKKYQPETVYSRYVPLHRVHLFTFIQFTSLVGLWVIKSNPTTSISFPVMLVVICLIRKMLECIFSRRELLALDDLLPEKESKNSRKGHFNRKWHKDDEEEEMLKAKEEDEKQRLVADKKARAVIFSSELDNYQKIDMKTKKAQYQGLIHRSKVNPNQMNGGWGPQGPSKCLIFVKLRDLDQEAFSPLNLNVRTVHALVRKLESKFNAVKPGIIRAGEVNCVFQKNAKNGLLFQMDDDMVELISANGIYEVELQETTITRNGEEKTVKNVILNKLEETLD